MGDRVPASMTIPVRFWFVRAARWEPDAEFVAIAFAGLPDGTCTSAGVASLQVCLEISSVTAEDAAGFPDSFRPVRRSEEHTSELQSRGHLVCRLLLEKKN